MKKISALGTLGAGLVAYGASASNSTEPASSTKSATSTTTSTTANSSSNITTNTSTTSTAATSSGANYLTSLSDADCARFLQQASFSSTTQEIAALKSIGIERWLANQIATPISVTGYNWLMTEYLSYYRFKNKEFVSSIYPKYAQQMIYHQLITQPDQLRKRIALALSEIFVVSHPGVDLWYISSAIASYWDMLNKNAFGNFRKLLGDVTFHPLMGDYLDTLGNTKANPAKGTAADENYAREVLQLFTIGLYELNIDGSLKLGTNGKPIETYNNDTIVNLAKVFTGFILGNVNSASGNLATAETHLLPMRVNESLHDTSTKTIFGKVIPAGTSGTDEINNALDIIFNHPNVGPFIGKQLIQRLTTSNPSPGYIRRVATVFNNNGLGVRGDMAAVIKAILTDSEARVVNKSDPYAGKVREPMVTWVQWLRTFTNRTSQTGHWTLLATDSNLNALNQSPFKSPSVFNFFEPEYTPSSSRFANVDKVAPELYLINENSIAAYQNFFIWFYARGGVWSSNGNGIMELVANYDEFLPLATEPQKLVDKLNLILAANNLNATTVATIVNAINTIPKDAKYALNAVNMAAFLIVISPSYRVQA